MRTFINRTVLAFLVPVLLATACNIFPDDRNNYLPDEKIYLNISEVRVKTSAENGSYDFAVIKSGKGMSEADVFLNFDSDALEEYNTLHGTSYRMVPENILQGFSEGNFHFEASDARKVIKVSWDPDAIAAYLKLGKYAIPVKISASGLQIVKDKDFILIVPETE